MPIQQCELDGKSGFQWGKSGKCFTYTSNSDKARNEAKAKAEAQGKAAYANGYTGSEDIQSIGTFVQELVKKLKKKPVRE